MIIGAKPLNRSVGPGGWPRVVFEGFKPGWEQWLLLTADRHWDNPLSDWKMQKRHLDKAVARNALIVDAGDFFCLMQGKYDPRASKGQLRPEHQVEAYSDAVIDTAVEFFAPYARNFLVIGKGNHEVNFLKRHETDMTRRLVAGLNAAAGSEIVAGGVRGWVTMSFKTKGGKMSPGISLYWHHGYGGGGPVTKNVIQANRMSVYLPDADIVALGHVHEYWHLPIQRARLTRFGVEYQSSTDFIQLPTYKQEFFGTDEGWHHDTGKPPKPIGAAWVRLFYEYDSVLRAGVVLREVTMAQ